MEITKEYPSIAEFYAGKTVALTGGTGFLGQGVIEKLLWGCPDIKKIIILIRTKRGTSPEERLEGLRSKPCFERLREKYPDFHKKLACVSCDLEAKDLGLTREGKKMLRNEVNVFVHSAATLKFNEIVRIAFEMNVQCTRRIVKLCKTFRDLHALVHISTAFVNTDRFEGTIEEKIYPSRINFKDMEKSLKWMSDESLDKLLKDILDKRPNTYTLTKAMAEDAIAEESGNMPVCIVRPGMITPALEEPAPGWIANVYGPTAFVAANIKGICRTCVADDQINADLVPVDFVVNGVISAAMKTATDRSPLRTVNMKQNNIPRASIDSGNSDGYASIGSSSADECSSSDGDNSDDNSYKITCFKKQKTEVPVYHLTTCSVTPMKLSIIVEGLNYWNKHFPADLYLPTIAMSTYNRNFYAIRTFMIEYLPAVWLDLLATMAGQRRTATLVYGKLMAGMDVMEFFFRYCFDFQFKKSRELMRCMTVKDQQNYSFDPVKIDWWDYMGIYCRGTRKYILREKTTDIQNRMKAYRIKQAYTVLGKAAELGVGAITSSFGITSCLWDSTSYCYR